MSAALHLAGPADLDRLCALVGAFHAEEGLASTEEARHAAIAPLLDGIPHGAAYLIGPTRAPVGYVILSFGWSLEFGGLDAYLDEIYLRPAVRGRGIASETLTALPGALAGGGIRAMHLEVDKGNEPAKRLYARLGFKAREGYMLMSKRL
jgi:ribosomal protein S18 acetylase RimI-like enzyme